MPDTSVARRYAQALIEIAAEAEATDAVRSDLERFEVLLDQAEALLRRTLCSPVFTTEERSAVLDVVLPRLGVHKLTSNVLHLVNDKGRMLAVSEIIDEFHALADERAGRVRVTVHTAEPLTSQIEAEVRAALEAATGHTVVLQTLVDPELLGGMIARVGGKVYDSSLRTRLENIKQALLGAQMPGVA